ncbi:UNVERIFIED_CONTAM: hypothetical protein Scaly_1477200, partial [Sesamum calycinum]
STSLVPVTKMFRGNTGNTAAPPLLDNHFLYPADMSNQLQSCGNLPAEFHANPQKLQISLNNRTFPDEADRKVSILNQNPVSTGLRLSYDDDERNSSITSGSGSLTAASSVFSSLSNDIRRELDQQKEEVDQFIKSQEETMMKGVRDIQQRHMASFLTALEKGQAMQNSNRGKEGLGESNVDDAASCIDPNNYLGVAGGSGRSGSVKKDMMCKSCKAKQMITTASFEVYLS